MSAFYDIWIGNNRPQNVRIGSGDWSYNTNAAYWLSTPENKQTFVKEVNANTHTLVILGQFYEDIDDSVLLRQCIDYSNNSSSSFNDPAGHYIIFLFDKETKKCHVFTDRLGTYHAYWRNEDGNNSISTYYLGLAKQSKDKVLDWQAITGFMGMGFFPNDNTYLKSIKIFNPASHYSFNEQLELLQQRRYWKWSHQPSGNSVKENIQQLDKVLTASMEMAVIDKNTALPISGGLDSRVLAGKLTRLSRENKFRLWGFSYGYSNTSIETKIAGDIAKKRKIPFEHYIVPDYLFDKMRSITDAVELFQYVDGTRQACMQDKLTQDADVVVGGHWGDVWMDDMGINVPAGANEDEILLTAFKKKIIKRGSAWLLKELCEPYYENGNTYLDTYFNDFISKYKYIKDPDFRMKIFKTDQWSFRWTLSSIRMYQAGAFPVLPFYDKRIVDLFVTIPTAQVKARELEVEYIKGYHPDLAKIKWQEYDSNLYNYKWLNNRNIIYRIIKKAQRMLSPGIKIARNWEIFYLNKDGRNNLERELVNAKFNNIVPAEKINDLLNSFYKDPSPDKGYSISMLLTFSQFIKEVM